MKTFSLRTVKVTEFEARKAVQAKPIPTINLPTTMKFVSVNQYIIQLDVFHRVIVDKKALKLTLIILQLRIPKMYMMSKRYFTVFLMGKILKGKKCQLPFFRPQYLQRYL